MDKTKRQLKEKIFKSITEGLSLNGFERSKSTFWVRQKTNSIQFIHIHTFSYAYSFRVHLGIRVKNDSFDATALNGPCTRDGWWETKKLFSKKRSLQFSDDLEVINKCAGNIIEYVETVGVPWFDQFKDENELLVNEKSPLGDEEKKLLKDMMNEMANEENLKLSNKVLGIK
ncbi:MAG: hypothetical protein ACTHOM_15670 [Allomuricauda sp.]